MNVNTARETLIRVLMAREAYADGASDYGDELLKDLAEDLERLIAEREGAVGDR